MNQSVLFVFIGIGIIIVLVILYYIYYYLPSKQNSSKYQIPLITSETVINEDFAQSLQMINLVNERPTLSVPKLGYGITFSWEMYIPNLPSNYPWKNSFGILKPIFSMNDSPQVGYNPKKNYLSVVLKYRDNPFYAQFSEIRFEEVKQQKWCKYILLISGRTVQLWVDGILVKTEYLPSLPVVYDIQSSITIGQKNNNFNGKIRNMIMYPFPVSYTELSSI